MSRTRSLLVALGLAFLALAHWPSAEAATIGGFPPKGAVLSSAGTSITSGYGGTASEDSAALNAGNHAKRVRFFVHVVTANASNLTTITIKLQYRYSDDVASVVLGYVDQGSTKSGVAPEVFEIEHAYTVAANQTNDFTFYIDEPEGIPDMRVRMHANAAGIAGDSVAIYASVGRP